jgi:hypothetical protein
MRRYTIRSLFDMMKSFDEANNNKYFIIAAGDMVKALLDYA